ncbi:MAG: murein biosynthesis integral membrane protein MurJ [Phycisphaerae bacterium]|jgi:putative peptidoglycan lipid II flippase
MSADIAILPTPPTGLIVRQMGRSSRLVSTTSLIASLTAGSRVLGLVRECVFSHYFGTSEVLSAFRIAFMAPNLARRLFGEGALSAAMIPVLTETLHEHGPDRSRRFVGGLFVLLVAMLAILVVGVEVVIAGWRTLQDDLALKLAAILMPYMVLICTVAIAGGVLQVRNHFATPAALPILLNIAIIVTALAGAGWAGLEGARLIYAICGAVLVAGVLQLAAIVAALRAVRFFPLLGGPWRDPQVRKVLTLMGPMVLGLSAVQINSLVDYLIAYLCIGEVGQREGPAVLGYAQFLYQLPLGVFGIALATAIFPVLSRKATERDYPGLADAVHRGMRLSLFIAMPASVGLMFVAHPLVAALYQHGASDVTATGRIASTLVFYSIGLVAYFSQHILVRTFYANHNSRTPARVALVIVVVNLVMNLSLVSVLQERGLALATAVCATIQAVWLSCLLIREIPDLRWKAVAGGALRMLVSTSAMAIVLTVFVSLTDAWSVSPENRSRLHVVTLVVGLVLTGVVSYLAACYSLGVEELRSALGRRDR